MRTSTTPGLDARPAAAAAEGAGSAPAPAGACLNCGAERLGDYCHRCGQHFREGRLRLRSVLSDFARESFTLERGLLRTVRDLTVRPGTAIREYVAGRRRRYVNPVAYFLFASAVAVLSFRVYAERVEAAVRPSADRMAAGDHPVLDAAQAEAFAQATVALSSHVAATYAAMAIPFALAIRWLFRRSGINLAEAATFVLFAFGHTLLLTAPVYPIVFSLAPAAEWASYVGGGVWFLLVTYLGVAFFGWGWRTLLRLLVAWGGTYLFVSFAMTTGILLYVLFFR